MSKRITFATGNPHKLEEAKSVLKGYGIVVGWFTAEDFLALMKDKNDRRIILHDVVAYFDGEQLKLFIYDQTGVFINEPRGEGTSMNQVVSMEDSGGLTIAEEFALRRNGAEINPAHFQHWQKFGEWFTARDND